MIELFAGNLAGWSAVSTGMPLDLLKTKLQLNKNLSLDYFRHELAHHGGFFRTFYRGASSIYLFIGVATAIEFTVFETIYDLMSNLKIPKEAQLMASGFMAGVGTSMIYTPIEFAKIQTQIDPNAKKMGSAHRMLHMLRTDKLAGLKKIYTGLPFSMLKESTGVALYFGGFHVCMMNVFGEKDRENASLWSQMGSAFTAGLIYNLWGYPIDTIKTNVQSGKATLKSLIKDRFWSQKSYKQGMVICVCRGIVVDGTNLTVYERLKNSMARMFQSHHH